MQRLEGVKSVDFPKGQVVTVRVDPSSPVKPAALAAAVIDPYAAESLEVDVAGSASSEKETITLKASPKLAFEIVKATSDKKDEKERKAEQAKLDELHAAFVKAVKDGAKKFKATGTVPLKKDGVLELRAFEALKDE